MVVADRFRTDPFDDAINISLSGEKRSLPSLPPSLTIMIQQFSDSSVEFSANLMNPDGVHCCLVHSTFTVALPTRPVMWLPFAQPVDGGRMETEVALSGFLDATSILDDACGATIELLYTSIEGRAMSTSTVRRTFW
jgi:hypothetical protein